MEKTAMVPPWKMPKGVSHFAHSSGDGITIPSSPLFCDKSNVETHANGLGIPDESPHVDVLGPLFGPAELRGTGADLLGEFGLGESLPLPLIGKLEPNTKNLSFFLECLADGWIGELLVEIAVPCVFHLRLFSFAVL